MGNRKAVAVSAAALLAAGTAAVAGWPAAPPAARGPIRLVSYRGCSRLLTALEAQALAQVGPYGLGYSGERFSTVAGGTSSAAPLTNAAAAAPAAATGTGTTAGVSGYSGTNDQVAGVGEPDIVKTNGTVMAVLRSDPVGLQTAAVDGLVPHLEGFLPLPAVGYPTGMFLTGGDAVVLSQGPPAAGPGVAYAGPTTGVTVVSLADPAHPAVARSFTVTGTDAGARLIAGRVVLVLQHSPQLPFTYQTAPGAAARAAATAHNRAVIEASTLSDWLPTITAGTSGAAAPVGCADSWQDRSATGLDTTSVVTLDPASAQPGPSTTVVGDASAVYASTDALYLADAAGAATDISEFDLSDPAQVSYVGSASVPGQLIGRYALDAWRGDLRVATTTGQATPAPGEGPVPARLSESRITVLAPSGGSLATVGAVTGLGSGEKIYAVRFEGPLAYVVTFRQTDPLYVVDLSDPARPVERGQVALTGFSTFLQPLGPSLLLGIGQQVDSRLRQTGLQLSVFDVSDPQNPALRSRADLGSSYSAAQTDPHALLWWPARRLVAMPLDDPASGFYGVAVWWVGAGGALHPVARLAQPATPARSPVQLGPGPAIGGPIDAQGPEVVYSGGFSGLREVVVGQLLYSVSGNGIMATDMNDWNRVAWLPFS